MRLSCSLLALLSLVLALPAPTAYAGEGEPPAAADEPTPTPAPTPAPESAAARPDPETPAYSIEFLMPGEDEDPEGWKIVDADKAPSGAPTEDGLTTLAEGLGLDDESFYVETTGLKKGAGVVAVALVDVEEKVYAFHAALKAAGASSGWRIKELGSPARLMIIGGASALAAEAEMAMVEHVVYSLGNLGMKRLDNHGALEAEGPKAALRYRAAIDTLVPNTGIAHAITGRIHRINALFKDGKGRKKKDIDKAELKTAGDFLEKSIAEGVKFPPRKGLLLWVGGRLGGMLLERKDPSVVATATRALEIAVKHEKEARSQQTRFSNRYNLACGYALGGQTEKALDALEAALMTMKSIKPRAARKSWEDMAKDKDFDSIRSDPRYSKMYADAEPKKPPHWDRDQTSAAKRKREQEAKEKEEAGKKKDGEEEGKKDDAADEE